MLLSFFSVGHLLLGMQSVLPVCLSWRKLSFYLQETTNWSQLLGRVGGECVHLSFHLQDPTVSFLNIKGWFIFPKSHDLKTEKEGKNFSEQTAISTGTAQVIQTRLIQNIAFPEMWLLPLLHLYLYLCDPLSGIQHAPSLRRQIFAH